MDSHKILIIKTGYSEILDKEVISRKVSFGDVLRTTPILHLYKNDKVTWLTDKEAIPLLEGNPYISRLMHYDFTTSDQLTAEQFDSILNLEKYPPLCGLVRKIEAWKRYGFRLDPITGEAKAYDRASEVLTVSADYNVKKENKKTTQELLFEMVGSIWNKEEYILGYKPKTKEEFDVGLNTKVGLKWPSKSWPIQFWNQLENRLTNNGLKVTRQDKQPENVLNNLYDYMDWINSSKIIFSNDSLGMHLGIALKKTVLGLFGPTSDCEVYFYERGKAILPEPVPQCRPCFRDLCERKRSCMEDISIERVYQEIKSYI